MGNKSEEMDVAYTPLHSFFKENITIFVKSKFWSTSFFLKNKTKQIGFILNRKVSSSLKHSFGIYGFSRKIIKSNFALGKHNHYE